jgi:hypothetical protein
LIIDVLFNFTNQCKKVIEEREVDMDLGQWIMIGLSAVLAIWFAIGFIYNRRRGESVSRWMIAGMKSLGEISEIAWIGSSASGARLVVKEAKSPFRLVEAVFLLESREILPIWILNRIRGKTDEVIIKADLRTAPKEVLEVSRHNYQKVKQRDHETNQKIHPNDISVPGFRVSTSRKVVEDDHSNLHAFLEKYGRGVQKISIHRRKPHLIVRLSLPNLITEPPEEIFQALHEILS